MLAKEWTCTESTVRCRDVLLYQRGAIVPAIEVDGRCVPVHAFLNSEGFQVAIFVDRGDKRRFVT